MTKRPTSPPPRPTQTDHPASEARAWPLRLGIDIGADTVKAVLIRGEEVEDLGLAPVRGRPLERVRELMLRVQQAGESAVVLGLTGTGAPRVAELLGVEPTAGSAGTAGAAMVDEPNAIAAACNLLYPGARTIIEMGARPRSTCASSGTRWPGDCCWMTPT